MTKKEKTYLKDLPNIKASAMDDDDDEGGW